jgi:hypothetical protein
VRCLKSRPAWQLQTGMTISAKGLIEWTTNPEMEGGTVVVTVLVLDERASMAAGVFAVTAVTVNPPPALAGIGPQTVEAGEELIVKPSATDPNDTELVYTATELPFGAVFDPETGFRWTPADDQLGVHEVTFGVTDPHGAADEELVVITVTLKPNVPPTIEPLETVVVLRGEKMSVQLVADDPDGDNAKLTYQLWVAPAEMTISAKGLIEWTTNPEMEGGTVEVFVLVLDERASMASGVFDVTVNQPPELAGIGPQTVDAGQELIVKPSATDPNDTELVYTATDLPVGAVFDPETGFRWTPADDQVGVHEVTFVVTDPHGAKASESVTITVTEAPKKPALTLLSSATVVGEYTEEPEAILDEVNKTFTVKMSGAMRFYRLRTTGETKLKMTSLQLQGDNAVIAYEIIGE